MYYIVHYKIGVLHSTQQNGFILYCKDTPDGVAQDCVLKYVFHHILRSITKHTTILVCRILNVDNLGCWLEQTPVWASRIYGPANSWQFGNISKQ